MGGILVMVRFSYYINTRFSNTPLQKRSLHRWYDPVHLHVPARLSAGVAETFGSEGKPNMQ